MASHKSKIPSILLPKQINSRVEWSVFNVQFIRLYNTIYTWLAHHKEDVANSPEWDKEEFDILVNTMNSSGLYSGTITNPIDALERLHALNVSQQSRLNSLEARVAALESATP